MQSQQREINSEERQAVFSILMALNSLKAFSAEIDKKLSIGGILRNILGETSPRKSNDVKPYQYPEPLQRNAAMILDRLEIELAAEIDLEAEPKEPTKPNATRPLKRRRKSSPQTSATELSQLRFEDPDLKHVMRGIVVSGKSRRAYLLDPTYKRRDCHVIGHNRLEVGDWWPLRLCALRDGAHGAIQGGIAGSSNDGAYSIVVSSMSSSCFCPSRPSHSSFYNSAFLAGIYFGTCFHSRPQHGVFLSMLDLAVCSFTWSIFRSLRFYILSFHPIHSSLPSNDLNPSLIPYFTPRRLLRTRPRPRQHHLLLRLQLAREHQRQSPATQLHDKSYARKLFASHSSTCPQGR